MKPTMMNSISGEGVRKVWRDPAFVSLQYLMRPTGLRYLEVVNHVEMLHGPGSPWSTSNPRGQWRKATDSLALLSTGKFPTGSLGTTAASLQLRARLSFRSRGV